MKEKSAYTEREVCYPREAVLAPGGRRPRMPPILGGLPVPANPRGPLGSRTLVPR
jgi:hypothetical protein